MPSAREDVARPEYGYVTFCWFISRIRESVAVVVYTAGFPVFVLVVPSTPRLVLLCIVAADCDVPDSPPWLSQSASSFFAALMFVTFVSAFALLPFPALMTMLVVACDGSD